MENKQLKESGHQRRDLKITVNNKEYEWPEQYITGLDVRTIAKIPPDEELYLAIKKPWEDERIEDDTKVDLARPGIEHFFSKKPGITLIVNGKEKHWSQEKISFEEVVKLVFPNYVDNLDTVYTVTYKKGPHQNPQGSMVKGDVVYVKNKMVFNVTATNKS
jgi:hypothetical protein